MLRIYVILCISLLPPSTLLGKATVILVEDLISKASANSPQIKSDTFKVEASSYLKSSSNYIPDPSVKFNYFTDPIETRNGPQRYNITVNQQIPWPGTIIAKAKQARFKEEKAAHMKKANLWRLAFSIRVQYASLIALKAAKAIQKEKLSALEMFKEVTLARTSVGKASLADVSRIEIEISNIKQGLMNLTLNSNRSVFSLEEQVGEKISLERIPSIFPNNTKKKQTTSEAKLKKHPLYKTALAQTNLQNQKSKVEQSNYFPKFSIFASWYNIEKPQPSFAGAASPGKDAFSFGVSITVPLWTAFSGRHSFEKNLRMANESDSRAIALNLKRNADSSLEELKTYEDIINLYETQSVPNAKKALKLDLESYSQNSVTVDQIVRDYHTLQDLESRLVTAKKLKYIANARLTSLGL